MLNPCWSNTKGFLSVLAVFGKSFIFAKNAKISKKSVALFWRLSRELVQSHVLIVSPHRDFSRLTGGSMPQSWKILRIFFKIWVFNISCDSVWRLVRGWKVQSWEGSKIFVAYLVTLLWVELPVAKNTLENFFSNFCFECSGNWPWRLSRDLTQLWKSCVLRI